MLFQKLFVKLTEDRKRNLSFSEINFPNKINKEYQNTKLGQKEDINSLLLFPKFTQFSLKIRSEQEKPFKCWNTFT